MAYDYKIAHKSSTMRELSTIVPSSSRACLPRQPDSDKRL